MTWGKAKKKPVVIDYREPIPDWTHSNGIEYEIIHTLEGNLLAKPGKHFIIKGVEGELYPIELDIFNKTYDVIEGFATNSGVDLGRQSESMTKADQK